MGELAFAGFFSAVPTTLVAGPAERVKVLLQIQGQGTQVSSHSSYLQLYPLFLIQLCRVPNFSPNTVARPT